MRQLVIKVLNITDARCNHEVYCKSYRVATIHAELKLRTKLNILKDRNWHKTFRCRSTRQLSRRPCCSFCVEARHEGTRDRDRLPRATVVDFVSSTVLSKLSCLYIMPIIVKLFTCTWFNISVGGVAGERGWDGVESAHVRCLQICTISTEHTERDPFTEVLISP